MPHQSTQFTYSNPWKFLWQVIKPYRWWYLLIFQAPALTAFYFFANNYSMKLIIDAFSSDKTLSYSGLSFPIGLFITAQIALDVIWRLSNVGQWKAVPYVRQAILAKTYDYVQHHSWRYFQNTPSGAIISKIKGIMDGYDKIFDNLHHNVGRCFCVVVISIFVLLVVNTSVFWFMLVWCVFFMLIMLPMAVKLNVLSNESTESKHQIIGYLSDNITNIFSLFYFAKRKDEYRRVNDLVSKNYLPKQLDLYYFNFKFQVIGALFYWVMLISIFLFMIYLRKKGSISTGDFMFVMLSTIYISFDLWSFMTGLCEFLKDVGDFKSSFSILSEPHDDLDDAEAKAFTIKKGKIEFKNLAFAYENASPIFSNLHLTIQPGEKIGLVGHSGAGKSTLISLLLKNFKPGFGDIFIDDKSISKVRTDSLRSQIALIPQDIMLFHRTIGENIAYAKSHATLEEIKWAATMANIADFIETLPQQYDTMVGERGVKLSGGQRQRIAIARAFLKNASIIILDEATASLDTLSELEIQHSINAMLEQNNATVIAIAHRLSTIRHMDRIIVMEGGVIIEEGRFDQLLAKEQGYFKKLWDSQVNGLVL